MFRFPLLALTLPLLCTRPVHARPVTLRMPLFQAVGAPEYILFRTVDNAIDCKSLGGPLFAGNFVSDAATIEMDSSVSVQVSYTNGTDLKSAQNSIPTTFEFALLGPASFDGNIATDDTGYTAFGDLPQRKANQNGVIEFPATMTGASKGLKARVIAERRGLQDRAGKYDTQIVLSWARF